MTDNRMRIAAVAAVSLALGAVVGVRALNRPSRDERADSAAQAACRVLRQPFDRPDPKFDALPLDERVQVRRRALVAAEADAATAARLSGRWSLLYTSWHTWVAGDPNELGDTAAFATAMAECRKALSGKLTRHDLDCEVARREHRYVEGCPSA